MQILRKNIFLNYNKIDFKDNKLINLLETFKILSYTKLKCITICKVSEWIYLKYNLYKNADDLNCKRFKCFKLTTKIKLIA